MAAHDPSEWCSGAGSEPRVSIENDWWVGPTGVCGACTRIVKLNKSDRLRRHKPAPGSR